LSKKRGKVGKRRKKKGGISLPPFKWVLWSAALLIVVAGFYLFTEFSRPVDRTSITRSKAGKVISIFSHQKGWTLLKSTGIVERQRRLAWHLTITVWRVDGDPREAFVALSKALLPVRLKERRHGEWSCYWEGLEIVRAMLLPVYHPAKRRAPAVTLENRPAYRAQVAVVIDDIGYRMDLAKAFLALPCPITLSVLPFTPKAREVVELAKQKGVEVMLHLPMEANGRGASIERLETRTPGMLRVGMNSEELRELVRKEMAAVPYAKGANNHMGSRFTRDPQKMRIVLEELKKRGYYFLDSLTVSGSVAYKVAGELGMRRFRRDIFLDNSKDENYILHQLDLLAKIALKRGFAVAIGHPSEATLKALSDGLPGLDKSGIRVVPLSRLCPLSRAERTGTKTTKR